MSTNFVKKGSKAIEKNIVKLDRLKIEYVKANSIRPNSYNPNRQSDYEFELLIRSMSEDGFTQPIVCMSKTREFVDGEHRWTAALVLHYLQKNNLPIISENIIEARDRRFEIMDDELEIPVVFVDMSIEQMMISTVRHNKARGTHDINLEADLFRDLQKLGAIDWAQDSLMLSDVEINKLLEDIPASEALAGEVFNNSWEVSDAHPEELESAQNGSTQAMVTSGTNHGGTNILANSNSAVLALQERSKLLEKARTEEEREMAKQQTKLYRVSLIFANDEAPIVEQVLGNEPAVNLIKLCKKELGIQDGKDLGATA